MMTCISLCASLLVCSFLQGPGPLEKYTWNQRVILVFSPGLNERHQQQLAELDRARPGVLDRDLVIISLFSKSGYGPNKEPLEAQDQLSLKQEYITPGDDFRFLLIGKDGGVKLDRTEIVTTSELFAVIDKMPMRKNEMKKKQ